MKHVIKILALTILTGCLSSTPVVVRVQEPVCPLLEQLPSGTYELNLAVESIKNILPEEYHAKLAAIFKCDDKKCYVISQSWLNTIGVNVTSLKQCIKEWESVVRAHNNTK